MKKVSILLGILVILESVALLELGVFKAKKQPTPETIRAAIYDDFAGTLRDVADSLESEYTSNRIAQIGGSRILPAKSPAIEGARKLAADLENQLIDRVRLKGKVMSKFSGGVMVDCSGELGTYNGYCSAGLVEWIEGVPTQKGWCSIVPPAANRLRVGEAIDVFGSGQSIDAYKNKDGVTRVVNRYSKIEP